MSRLNRPPGRTVEWETPRDLFDYLWTQAGGFDFDPCTGPGHYSALRILQGGGHVCVKDAAAREQMLSEWNWVRPERVIVDGLGEIPWVGDVYMNPPYGREIRPWVRRARLQCESNQSRSVWGLVPVRTDTRWWQENVTCTGHGEPCGVGEIWFVPSLPGGEQYKTTRLRFGGASQGADFPSAVVIWRSDQ